MSENHRTLRQPAVDLFSLVEDDDDDKDDADYEEEFPDTFDSDDEELDEQLKGKGAKKAILECEIGLPATGLHLETKLAVLEALSASGYDLSECNIKNRLLQKVLNKAPYSARDFGSPGSKTRTRISKFAEKLKEKKTSILQELRKLKEQIEKRKTVRPPPIPTKQKRKPSTKEPLPAKATPAKKKQAAKPPPPSPETPDTARQDPTSTQNPTRPSPNVNMNTSDPYLSTQGRRPDPDPNLPWMNGGPIKVTWPQLTDSPVGIRISESYHLAAFQGESIDSNTQCDGVAILKFGANLVQVAQIERAYIHPNNPFLLVLIVPSSNIPRGTTRSNFMRLWEKIANQLHAIALRIVVGSIAMAWEQQDRRYKIGIQFDFELTNAHLNGDPAPNDGILTQIAIPYADFHPYRLTDDGKKQAVPAMFCAYRAVKRASIRNVVQQEEAENGTYDDVLNVLAGDLQGLNLNPWGTVPRGFSGASRNAQGGSVSGDISMADADTKVNADLSRRPSMFSPNVSKPLSSNTSTPIRRSLFKKSMNTPQASLGTEEPWWTPQAEPPGTTKRSLFDHSASRAPERKPLGPTPSVNRRGGLFDHNVLQQTSAASMPTNLSSSVRIITKEELESARRLEILVEEAGQRIAEEAEANRIEAVRPIAKPTTMKTVPYQPKAAPTTIPSMPSQPPTMFGQPTMRGHAWKPSTTYPFVETVTSDEDSTSTRNRRPPVKEMEIDTNVSIHSTMSEDHSFQTADFGLGFRSEDLGYAAGQWLKDGKGGFYGGVGHNEKSSVYSFSTEPNLAGSITTTVSNAIVVPENLKEYLDRPTSGSAHERKNDCEARLSVLSGLREQIRGNRDYEKWFDVKVQELGVAIAAANAELQPLCTRSSNGDTIMGGDNAHLKRTASQELSQTEEEERAGVLEPPIDMTSNGDTIMQAENAHLKRSASGEPSLENQEDSVESNDITPLRKSNPSSIENAEQMYLNAIADPSILLGEDPLEEDPQDEQAAIKVAQLEAEEAATEVAQLAIEVAQLEAEQAAIEAAQRQAEQERHLQHARLIFQEQALVAARTEQRYKDTAAAAELEENLNDARASFERGHLTATATSVPADQLTTSLALVSAAETAPTSAVSTTALVPFDDAPGHSETEGTALVPFGVAKPPPASAVSTTTLVTFGNAPDYSGTGDSALVPFGIAGPPASAVSASTLVPFGDAPDHSETGGTAVIPFGAAEPAPVATASTTTAEDFGTGEHEPFENALATATEEEERAEEERLDEGLERAVSERIMEENAKLAEEEATRRREEEAAAREPIGEGQGLDSLTTANGVPAAEFAEETTLCIGDKRTRDELALAPQNERKPAATIKPAARSSPDLETRSTASTSSTPSATMPRKKKRRKPGCDDNGMPLRPTRYSPRRPPTRR